METIGICRNICLHRNIYSYLGMLTVGSLCKDVMLHQKQLTLGDPKLKSLYRQSLRKKRHTGCHRGSLDSTHWPMTVDSYG